MVVSPSVSAAVWASPLQPSHTGVGVLQRELYLRLMERGVAVSSAARPSNGLVRVAQALGSIVRPPYVAALVCTTPGPLVVRVPYVAFVYDLRWRRTRWFGSRLYRYLDLRRTVASADHVFAISARTRDDVLSLFPTASQKCSVLHLGPGIVGKEDFSAGEPGTVLLLGSAAYKRNALVAEALAIARPTWAERFLCVGLDDTVFRTIANAFGEEACERYDKIGDPLMRTLFRRARSYLTGSMEEGFGLPMVEALSAGCQVVAIRQPLTAEILGEAGVFIDDGDAPDIAEQLRELTWVASDVRAARASMFSWDLVADAVAAQLTVRS
jgi:glycosyltransferase involved in cell wall biosynthesis